MDILNIDIRVLIVQAGGFLLLVLALKFFLFKPVLGMLEARRSEVENQYREADARREEGEKFKADYEQRLMSVDSDIRARITKAVKEGQKIREEIVAESHAKAEERLAKAQEEIQREKEKAIVEIRAAVADLAIAAAGKLIEEKLDPAKHHELVGKFIDDLNGVRK